MDYKLFLKSGPVKITVNGILVDIFPNKLELSEVLQQQPIALLGMTDTVNTQLLALGIKTVYDLALSKLFSNCARIVDGSTNTTSVINKFGATPEDLVLPENPIIPLTELPIKSITKLVGFSVASLDTLAKSLGFQDAANCAIRDLAFWLPFVAAKNLLTLAYNPYASSDYDVNAPEELIPRSGKYATQKYFYKSTVLIETKPTLTRPWQGDKINLSELDDLGFSGVGFGALLTFSQTWFSKGVALGQLLHSLPLAPGESTKMTIIDWYRKVSSSTQESESQAEFLSSAMEQSTSISEVTTATAREHQEGSSVSGSTSASQSAGGAGLLFPLPIVAEAGESSNVSAAGTYTTSSGTRSVSAQSQQNINARTQQNSSLSRNKRAAIVSEVSQSESENISTRTVTNYNHMHALSIQYYEVVQIYETVVGLNQGVKGIQRCIFLPMKLIDFQKESNIKKYLKTLIRFSLDSRLRKMLFQYRNTVITEFAFDRFASTEISELQNSIFNLPPNQNKAGIQNPFFQFAFSDDVEKKIQLQLLSRRITALKNSLRSNYESARINRFIESYDKTNFKGISAYQNVTFNNCAWEASDGIENVILTLQDGTRITITESGDISSTINSSTTGLANSIPIVNIKSISITMNTSSSSVSSPSDFAIFKLFFQLKRSNDKVFWLDSSFVTSKNHTGNLIIMNFHSAIDLQEVKNKLMENQLYYSQQIWLHADTQSLTMQMAPLTLTMKDNNDQDKIINLIDYIDAKPLSVAGNYLVFKFNYEEDKSWIAWKTKETSAPSNSELVPLPSGGIFAEAVLGEFNSAEKLDMTRFWKWQDSPIPFAAPEIGPAEAGKHKVINAPVPGNLPASLLSIQQPLTLPVLSTSKDAIGAVTAANIFRDMSGNEITGALVKASMKAASEGDAAAMKQANETLNKVFEAFNSLVKTAAGSGGDVLKTITQLGAAVNSSGGGSAAGTAASAGSAISSAEGIAGLAETAMPIVEELAPMLLAL